MPSPIFRTISLVVDMFAGVLSNAAYLTHVKS